MQFSSFCSKKSSKKIAICLALCVLIIAPLVAILMHTKSTSKDDLLQRTDTTPVVTVSTLNAPDALPTKTENIALAVPTLEAKEEIKIVASAVREETKENENNKSVRIEPLDNKRAENNVEKTVSDKRADAKKVTVVTEPKANVVKNPPAVAEPKVAEAKIKPQPAIIEDEYLVSKIKFNLERYASDKDIIEALSLLKARHADEIFDNLDALNAEVKFYDFELLGYEYRKHYAINTKKGGKTTIAINTRYKGSPVEAIASLIVHESFHKMSAASLEEEVFCTMMEAKYWRMLKNPNKRYSDEDVLVFKLDNWATMYLAITQDNNPIRTKIANSAFYKERLV